MAIIWNSVLIPMEGPLKLSTVSILDFYTQIVIHMQHTHKITPDNTHTPTPSHTHKVIRKVVHTKRAKRLGIRALVASYAK